MKKSIIMLTLTFLFVGCATLPPPRVENGKYINPKFEFAIDIPEGWKQVNRLPQSLKSALSLTQRAGIAIMFFNNETNGMIAIYRDKTMVSYPAVCEYIGYKGTKEYLKKIKKEILKDPYMKKCSYEIEAFDRWSTELYYETKFQKLRGISNTFRYRCHKDDTCSVAVWLVSDVKTFDENESVYLKMINSLQKGYVEVIDK